MKPYSTDLRAKIVAAYHSSNSSQAEVARRFGVSEATVKKLLRRKRLHGSIEPLPHRGGQQLRAAEDVQEFVIATLIKRNDLTLQELCEAVYEHSKLTLSTATMCRLLKKLGFTRKKNSRGQRAAYRRDTPGA